MKKSLSYSLLLAIACIMGMSACNGCSRENRENAKPDIAAGTEHVQAMHRQTMYGLIGNEHYEWRNSKVMFSDTIKTENIDQLKVKGVTDVFFYSDDRGPHVQIITSDEDGTEILPAIQDVWIEDADISDREIKLTAEDALQKLKEWNGVIPPAVSASLRRPVGPKKCNPQWVIGNVSEVVFIDAATGEISDWNPAFRPDTAAEQ